MKGSAFRWLLLLALQHVWGDLTPVVHCPWGSVQGVYQTSPTGKSYITYLGIPYSQPPLGSLRFENPVPHPGPEGIFKTTATFGAVCPQPPVPHHPLAPSSQDEDCLTLNVFTPEMSSSTPRAVMVWVHGGGWYRGGAVKFNMWKITTQAQIFGVSIQYRLGALGFLSTGSTVIPGNYAMLDQVLALKWVKDNIASFGGDVNNITIYGQSAGGASVSYHTLSPLSKGLFERVIMQSGSALGFWTTRTDASKYAYQLAKNVNCPISQNQSHNAHSDMRMIECLRKLPYRSIVDGSDFNLSLTSYSDDAVWSPVVDNHFLVGEPSRLIDDASFLQSVGFNEYDMMFGVNNAEGGIMVHLAMQYGDLHNISGLDIISKPGYFQGEYLHTILKRIYGEFLNVDIDVVEFESQIYVANQQPYPLFNQTAVQVVEQMLNTAFLMSAYRIARARDLNKSSGKTFLYFFDHYPTYAKRFYITGISHGDDINYSFGINDTLIRRKYNITGNISQEEYLLSDKFVQILAQFEKTCDPNSVVKDNLSTVWPEFSGPDWSYLSFTTNMEVKTHLRCGWTSSLNCTGMLICIVTRNKRLNLP